MVLQTAFMLRKVCYIEVRCIEFYLYMYRCLVVQLPYVSPRLLKRCTDILVKPDWSGVQLLWKGEQFSRGAGFVARKSSGVSCAGFVFYAPRAGAARSTGRAGAWPFSAVRRYSELEELSSLWLSTNDSQSSPIQIVNNIRISQE